MNRQTQASPNTNLRFNIILFYLYFLSLKQMAVTVAQFLEQSIHYVEFKGSLPPATGNARKQYEKCLKQVQTVVVQLAKQSTYDTKFQGLILAQTGMQKNSSMMFQTDTNSGGKTFNSKF